MFGTDLVERQSFTVWRHDPAVVDEYEHRLNQSARRLLNRREGFSYAATGVSWSGLDEFIRSRRVWVLLGDIIEHRLVDENVTRGPYERKPPEYNGYLLYGHPDEPKAIAATDGVVLLTDRPFDDHDPETVLKGVIDTGLGQHTRLEEQRPVVQEVARWTGSGTITDMVDWSAESDPPQPGLHVGGVSYSFNEDGAGAKSVLQFESVAAAKDTSYEDMLDRIVKFQNTWTDTQNWRDGRRLITEGHVSYEKIFA